MLRRLILPVLFLLLAGGAVAQYVGYGTDDGYVGYAGYGPPVFASSVSETVMVVLTMEIGMTSAYALYDDAVAAADTVLELETDVALAYTTLLNTSANNASNVNTAAWYGDTTTDWDLFKSGRKINLFRIDWMDFIPAGAKIIESTLYQNSAGQYFIASTDSVYAVAMDNASDNLWWTSKFIEDGSDDRPSYTHSSWDYQIQGYDGEGADTATLQGYTFPEFSSGAWSPSLASRDKLEDWGGAIDLNGNRSGINPWPHPTGMNLRNCTQHVVNGADNNGIHWGIRDYNGGAPYQFLSTIWESNHPTFHANRPFVIVKYVTKRYQYNYPGNKDWAFVFCTDAAISDANTVYRDAMNARGWKYTIFLGGNEHDVSGHMTTADLIAARAEGHEIGTQGLFHENLTTSYPAAAVDDTVTYQRGDLWADITGSSTDWDKLLTTTSPKWLHDIMPNTWDDPYVGKSFAMAFSAWSGAVLKAMRYHYYDAYRVGNYSPSGYLTPDNYYAHVARPLELARAAKTDSLWGGFNPMFASKPRNLVGFSMLPSSMYPWPPTNPDVGAAVEATFKEKMRHVIHQVRGNREGYLIMFSHELRNLGAYGSAGITAIEFDWILEVVEEMGGYDARVSENARYLQSNATMIATPAAYAQNDSFKFAAGDSTWFRMDGVDSLFVPGVK